MPTIVEYSVQKPSGESYPSRIISPMEPSVCCRTDMAGLGGVEAEGDRSFYYKRCQSCGFTVRYFLPHALDLPSKPVPVVDRFTKLAALASCHPWWSFD